MSPDKNSRPNSFKPVKHPNYAIRAFGGLKVRHKLAVLHNIFFFVLAASVYLSVIPSFSSRLDGARQRELKMISQIFAAELPLDTIQDSGGPGAYPVEEGSAEQTGLSKEGWFYLSQHPNGTWEQDAGMLFRASKAPGLYRRVTLPREFYEQALRQARITLFVVLGTIYLLSIAILEFIIMPQYVYQPLALMLKADDATQQGDRASEMIDREFILNDEIGQIMLSRNNTVAQLRRQEDDLAIALQKLEEQDRLVSLGLLSTSVAHELNTPLAVLQGSIEKLLETSPDSLTRERLGRMLRVARRMSKISEGLVDFARVRKQEAETVALRPLIDESWSLVAIDEKASAVAFENRVRPEEAVTGNADRLVQVFVNLLRNALLAVSPAGLIEVESKCLQRGGQNWVCCTVTDDGPGIPAHVLPNIFEAFVTTRLDARGTGLGLTVAEGIVTQHGGTIAAFNRPTGGASVEVLLPAGRTGGGAA
ncbi:MAG TPA: HAMP domain-containing sensor histidine kinase [Bryobacteraceae bacterium]|nr:HAMP domain-containing sensor histidine kinase [Bryobacteraceae bacterium]